MRYHGSIIRPPSEADSLILQVTYGCSHNTCDFCGTYLDKPFSIRPFEEVQEDVRGLPGWARDSVRRVFLADGDAMVLPQGRLLAILALLRDELPALERVSTYANTQSLRKKSVAQLAELREAGLVMAYLGLESGDDQTLASCHKGVTAAEQIGACRLAKEAGLELSITALLGLAGKERWCEHAVATGQALSAIDPEFIGVLSLMVIPGTPLAERVERGEFVVPEAWAMIRELREMIAAIDVTDALFRANHASNYVTVKGRLPQDKQRLLASLDEVLAQPDEANLRPEGRRML